MHHIERTTVSGRVEHVFAHRFTVKTADAVILADLTPHGARHVPLKSGDDVVIEGEQKPSELRVETIAIGHRTYVLPAQPEHLRGFGSRHQGAHHHGPHHRGPHHGHDRRGHGSDAFVDTAVLKKAVEDQGYDVIGEARLRHRHAEWLARKDGSLFEVHVDFGGEVRKAKPAEMDGKWAGRSD
jgi:hypothetical protein